MKRTLSVFLVICLLAVTIFTGCGNIKEQSKTAFHTKTTEIVNQTSPKILRVSQSFALETLNPHLDYQGWYTSIYGLTESLFVMSDQSVIEPLLAKSAEVLDNVWTINLKENICFSNGNPVTSDMVIRNLEKAGEDNSRFAHFTAYTYEIVNEHSFTIRTNEVYPTLLNDLASPELAIVDLDNSKDMKTELIATGPFTIASFTPGGTIEVTGSKNYWGGEVALDGAIFYYIPDADTALMAMQNGEIDTYTSVTSDAAEIYAQDTNTYQLVTVPATRLQFYILNQNRLEDAVRKAINLTIDSEEIEKYLRGSVSSTAGPFGTATAYGKVTKAPVDTSAAQILLKEAGYTQNTDGYYEKDNRVLSLNIAYYAARSLDTLAAIMQEQLEAIGIKVTLTCEEDPDGTYIVTGDFDIALYCMIADKNSNPYYFISCTLAQGAPYNCGGFKDVQIQGLIDSLKVETDAKRRADLANQIIQRAIDKDAFGYIALFNKTTVMKNGVINVKENSPYDFYFLNAATDMN